MIYTLPKAMIRPASKSGTILLFVSVALNVYFAYFQYLLANQPATPPPQIVATHAPTKKIVEDSCPSTEAVFQQLYCPLGFHPADKSLGLGEEGFVALRPVEENCPKVFQRWLEENKGGAVTDPPRRPPKELEHEYRMRGFGELLFAYFPGDAKNSQTKQTNHLNQGIMDRYLKNVKDRNYGQWNPWYSFESASMLNAMLAHPPGDRGMTIGTIYFWVEAIALTAGAKNIIISEYQPINSTLPNVKAQHPSEVAKRWNEFGNLDFVATFSSLEHSGLGRFGDPMTPYGDILEVQKARCLLKPGGLFFLGLQVGQDDVTVWNGHRWYNRIRWPLMTAGFKHLGLFYGEGNESTTMAAIMKGGFPGRSATEAYHQAVAVLQKV